MNNEPDFTPIEELMDIPLADLIELQWLDLPEIEPQDLDLPRDYLQDLMERGVIGEDVSTPDLDTGLLESPEPEQLPMVEKDEPTQEHDVDFGR
jgi:hypothetical protein